MTTFTFPIGFDAQLQILLNTATDFAKIDPSSQQTKDSFGQVYTFILDAITINGAPAPGVSPSVWEWVNGAKDVNSDTGFFADFIRQYTEEQFRLRYGDNTLSQAALDTKVQETSNQIAENFANDIINRIKDPNSPPQIPALFNVVTDDAGAAASTIFNNDFSPWAGTVLFSYLGDSQPMGTFILQPGTVQNPDPSGGTFKSIPGTYDLVSMAEVTQKLETFSNAYSAFKNSPELLATMNNNDLGSALATETLLKKLQTNATTFYKNAYGLTNESGFNFDIGSSLPLATPSFAFSLAGAPNFIVGTLAGGNTLATNNASITILPGGEIQMNSDGNDIVNAGSGNNNTIKGSTGNDLIDGGGGTGDTVSYANLTGGITVTQQAVNGTLYHDRFVVDKGTGGKDFVYGVENITGSAGNDTITGNAQANVFTGGLRDDLLTGNAGNDYLDGGDGTDTASYANDPHGVYVNLTVGTATDGWRNTDTLVSIENAIGSNQGDILVGGPDGGTLSGGGGDDTLVAGGGNSILVGGDGNDTLVAGSGSTQMYGGSGRDFFVIPAGGGGNVTLNDYNVAHDLDTIVFTGGGAPAPFRDGNDLVFPSTAGNGQTRIPDFFSGPTMGGRYPVLIQSGNGPVQLRYVDPTTAALVPPIPADPTDPTSPNYHGPGPHYVLPDPNDPSAPVILNGPGDVGVSGPESTPTTFDVDAHGRGGAVISDPGGGACDTIRFTNATLGQIKYFMEGADLVFGVLSGTGVFKILVRVLDFAASGICKITASDGDKSLEPAGVDDSPSLPVYPTGPGDFPSVPLDPSNPDFIPSGPLGRWLRPPSDIPGLSGPPVTFRGLPNYIHRLVDIFGHIAKIPDPISVDMNGDGVITQTPPNAVYFDTDSDGMKEAVSWIGPQDGMLAMDLNHNGVIDNAGELFASYAQLAALDANHDGKIDAQDAAYGDLLVWQDKNQDGISQAGELLSVQNDLFFEEIPVTAGAPIEAAIGHVAMQNIDFNFINPLNTVYGGNAPLDFAALALPELRGYGNLPNLSMAMSINPDLLAIAQNIASQSLAQLAQNFASISQQFDTLLYTWAGVQDESPTSRGPFMDDARKLEFLENIVTRKFTQFGTGGSADPLSIPAAAFEQNYADVKEEMMGRFLMQAGAGQLYDTPPTYDPLADMLVFNGTPHLSTTTLDALGSFGATLSDPTAFWASVAYMIDATHNPDSNNMGDGLARLAPDEIAALDAAVQISYPGQSWSMVSSNFQSLLPQAPLATGPNANLIIGTNGDDNITAGSGDDTIFGLEGADVLNGGAGGDHLIGGNGADELIGGSGGDVLEAGTGGTLLEGGDGSDTYINHWGASDYIVDTGGANDTLILPDTAPPGAVYSYTPYVERVLNDSGNAYDLKVVHNYVAAWSLPAVTTETVLQDQFNPNNPNALIEDIDWNGRAIWERLPDGSIGISRGVNGGALLTTGTAGNDVITNLDVRFFDSISGQGYLAQGEVIIAGAGDDTVTVNAFSNGAQTTYAEGGDGNDTLTGRGDGIGGSGINYNFGGIVYEIELNGGNGSDTMIADSGNVFMLGAGSGGLEGDDSYIWKSGKALIYDQAYNGNGSSVDTAVIDRANVSLSDFTFSSGSFGFSATDVLASLNGTSEQIVFADNLVSHSPGYNTLENLTLSYQGAPSVRIDRYDQWQVGGTGDDVLSGQTVLGQDGDDTLSGTSGDDVLAGGRGDDTLVSDAGSDDLDGGDGNDTFIYSKPDDTVTHTQAVGGRGIDTLQLNLTSAQFADPAVLNDIFLYQNFLTTHTDSATLLGAGFTFSSLRLTASDMEGFTVFVDGVEQTLTPPANTPPVAQDDMFTVVSGQTVTGNLLADNGNGADTDADNNVLSATPQSFTTVNGGAVTIQTNGNFTYAAATGFSGPDTFVYTLDDGFGGQATASVNITVDPIPNRAPVAVNDIFNANGHGIIAGNVLADNGHNGFGVDYDLDRDPLSVQAQSFVTGNGGTVVLQADGSFTYQAADGYTGADSFNYTLQDNRGGTAIGAVNISNIAQAAANTAPVAQEDDFTTITGTPLTGNLFADNGHGADADADHDALSTTRQLLTTAQGGTVTIQTNGDFAYTSVTGYTGPDSFDYTVRDGFGGASTATVNITVNAVPNDAPVAMDDQIRGDFNGGATGNVLADNGNGADTDPDGDALTVTAQNLTTANGGTVVLQQNGDFVYQSANAQTRSDSFDYTVTDGRGGSATATVAISSLFTDLPPVAQDDAFTTVKDHVLQGNVLANDTDPGNNPLTTLPQNLTTANGGTVVLSADGNFTYTPPGGFIGADTFSYIVRDSIGLAATANVTLTVTSGNRPPVAVNDTIDAAGQASASGNVLANDTDPDNDPLTVVAQTVTTAGGNTAIIAANGTVTIQAAEGFRGNDSFSYTAQDPAGAQSPATVTVNNLFTNRAPVAATDSFDAAHAGSASGNVLTNDSDPDNDSLSVVAQTVTTANGGQVVLNADGSFTYQAASGFRGSDSFGYTVYDVFGATAAGTATISDIFADTAPVAQADSFTALYGQPISGNVLANDSDANGDPLHVVESSVTTTNGTVIALAPDGSFTYTPPEDFIGNDSFSYTASDGNGGTSTATVSLSVTVPAGSLVGTSASNTLTGTATAGYIYGLGGGDTLNAGSGNYTIYGGSGADTIKGGSGNDRLYGGSGNDSINGGSGNDLLDGGNGSDLLNGGSGADTLTGGDGLDTLTGGSGADAFVFESATAYNNIDVLADFHTGDHDAIDIRSLMSAYTPGVSTLGDFVQAVNNGAGGSWLQVDSDGVGSAHSFQSVVSISGVTNLNVGTYVSNGNLLVA